MDRRAFLAFASLIPVLSACGGGGNDSPSTGSSGGTGSPVEPVPVGRHAFSFATNSNDFLIDGQSFQIRSGEMHPARIPVEYWQHRIQMAKAMGLNTISIYIMWNYHESSPGVFDFSTENRDIESFIRLCQSEGLWVLVRPGPYVCAEWDLGGIPSYLLAYPDIKLRTDSVSDPRYMAAVRRYIAELAPRIAPLMASNGGPILMLQVENEFGSFDSNAVYLEEIRQCWLQNGIAGPFYTEDGIAELMHSRSNVAGGAIALSNGSSSAISTSRSHFAAVPAMAGEVYTGWFSHWGDAELGGSTADISSELASFMQRKQSFNLYMVHGGTSFGFFAGANLEIGTGQYQPDITSYDYFAPISEQGAATAKFLTYRNLIASHLSTPPAAAPALPGTLTLTGASAPLPTLYASIWDNLPSALPASQTIAPLPFEMFGQSFGFALYRKTLGSSGAEKMKVTELHDYATIFLAGQYAGALSRPALPVGYTRDYAAVAPGTDMTLPAVPSNALLEILVEGMGRVNYGSDMIDRKGITQSVSLTDSMGQTSQLQGWEIVPLPMDESFIANLKSVCTNPAKSGLFFQVSFNLTETGDTFLDMSQWTKGVVWVNGRNLGRYWKIGPQTRLYCPAPWLRAGINDIIIFDLHQLAAAPIPLVGRPDA